ncbi:small membrane A-kinase anchor protein-like [Scomber scombrus]|uniref:Small membrane A-kinase anchor protein-like n=1 Tax=Scomber scombrus TaxID=13677 RepID=A0AAV1PK17_SCOSC
MGCSGSRCRSRSSSDKPKQQQTPKQQQSVIDEEGVDETEAFLEDVKETKSFISEDTPADGSWLDLPPVSKPMLDFAQKMSEDIVAQALQLCWKVQIQYMDLPFIDSDCDYVI